MPTGTIACILLLTLTPHIVVKADGTADASTAFSENPLSGPDSVHTLEKDFQEEKSDLLNRNLLEQWEAWKSGVKEKTGLGFGGDYTAVGFVATSSPGDDTSASGILRVYGSWDLLNRRTENTGRLVYKVEYRHSYTRVPPQTFGFEIGYAGLPEPVFNDEGFRVTELNWGQHFLDGRGVARLGFVDIKAYYDVYALASPWSGFGNLVFSTGSATQTVLPDGAFGAMVGGYLTDEIYAIAGIADANSNPTAVFAGFDTFFGDFDTFKSFELGVTGGGTRLFADNLHATFWQMDGNNETGRQGGWGINVSASKVIEDKWMPFLRGGWANEGDSVYEASVSTGFGYMNQPGGNLLGTGINWGRPNSSTFPIDLNDQWTGEIFYRVQLSENVQITPSVQLLFDPALYNSINAPNGGGDKDLIALFGVRARAQF